MISHFISPFGGVLVDCCYATIIKAFDEKSAIFFAPELQLSLQIQIRRRYK